MIKHQGIALIQVLLITAILTVFALYFTKTARNQVEMAQWSTDRAKAEAVIHSAFAELTFTLFTNEKEIIEQSESGTSITQKWNFFNKPFQINQYVTAKIQDQSGLLSLHFLDKELFVKFLTANNVELSRAEQIADHLLDWQDTDNIPRPLGAEQQVGNAFRNGYIPDKTDIEHAIALTQKEKELIYNNTTIYFNGSLNPLTASKELIATFSDEFSAELFTTKRQQGENFNQTSFKQLTGAQIIENMNFLPVNTLAISLTANVGQAVVTKQFVILLSRYAVGKTAPIYFLLEKS
ncbi:general secretion pathway protein GspK [Pseudoalteromonas distincta]|uniref:general secretion pathway protein GspK n=1 Tax=Pseudoalteromonas distincta TaxID=77608 RepID=UPI0032E186E4